MSAKIHWIWGRSEKNYHNGFYDAERVWHHHTISGPSFTLVKLDIHYPSTGYRFIYYFPSGAWWHFDLYFDRRGIWNPHWIVPAKYEIEVDDMKFISWYGGTTGAVEPVWPKPEQRNTGAKTKDGGITWTYMGSVGGLKCLDYRKSTEISLALRSTLNTFWVAVLCKKELLAKAIKSIIS